MPGRGILNGPFGVGPRDFHGRRVFDTRQVFDPQRVFDRQRDIDTGEVFSPDRVFTADRPFRGERVVDGGADAVFGSDGDASGGSSALRVTFAGEALTGERATVREALRDAWSAWTANLNVPDDAAITLRVDSTASGGGNARPDALAFARTGFLETGTVTVDGNRLVRSEVAAELRDGRERAGEVDASVTFAADLDRFAFGGDAGAGRFDAATVLKHEVGHVLGFVDTGTDDGLATPFEAATFRGVFGEQDPVFQGEAAGEVPLADPAHLRDGLMAPTLDPGTTKSVTDTELAVLEDIGLPVDRSAPEPVSDDPFVV